MADTVRHEIGEVEPGLTLATFGSVQQCDALLDRLQAGIVSIEQQLAGGRPTFVDKPANWRHGAKAALRAKKFWLPRVQAHRAEIVRLERQVRSTTLARDTRDRVGEKRRIMVRLAWDTEPEAMKRVEVIARERYPDLFTDGEAA